MINTDKRADLFGMEDDDGFVVMNDDKRDGFKAGAEWMREELMRWNDPRKILPPAYDAVLCKARGVESDQYLVLHYADCKWWRHCECSIGFVPHYYDEFVGCVIGWRYIHE